MPCYDVHSDVNQNDPSERYEHLNHDSGHRQALMPGVINITGSDTRPEVDLNVQGERDDRAYRGVAPQDES